MKIAISLIHVCVFLFQDILDSDFFGASGCVKYQQPQMKLPDHPQFQLQSISQSSRVPNETLKSMGTTRRYHRFRYSPYPSTPSAFPVLDQYMRHRQTLSTPPRSMLERKGPSTSFHLHYLHRPFYRSMAYCHHHRSLA